MNDQLLGIIGSEYGLRIEQIAAAPRQFVAETYTVTAADGQMYFCKVVDKRLWIPKIIVSLPVLDALHQTGFGRISYPIKTSAGALYVMSGETLIVLYNYIDAVQSYDFDYETFGRLMSEVHSLTNRVKVEIPREAFALKHETAFGVGFEELLTAKSGDPVRQWLQQVLRKHEAEIRKHYATLQRAIDECSRHDIRLVITHGDAGGNVLVKAPSDLYIIDWDEILLAPAERDLWIHANNPAFMAGYRRVYPGYQLDEVARQYCLCSQYFDYIAYFLAEILGDGSAEYRGEKLNDLDSYFDGWIKQAIDSIYQ